ncbi:MAG: zinc-finger domain-containing protein [Thiohalomonadales bacterium]
MANNNSELKPANAENKYQVTSKDLPLHCPMDHMILWDSHPRVFLPIEDTGKAKCPYCGAEFELSD